jgi:PBSX family phage portal protein
MARSKVTKTKGTGPDAVSFTLEVEKSAQSKLFEQVLGDFQITEWSQAGQKVIKYPIDLGVLLQSTIMGPYHNRCLEFKRIATIGNGYDTKDPEGVKAVLADFDLSSWVDDFFLFANGYLEREQAVSGRVAKLHHVRANSLWKTSKGDWVQRTRDPEQDKDDWKTIDAAKILHLREYSALSDHYGVPKWLPALLPVALTWESNDFKRKFYQNGAHAGLLILLTGITGLTQPQMDELEKKIKGTKGPGNFNTLFIALKNAEAKVEIKGVAKETPVRDDYPEIQKACREQVLTAHGLPPRLMSIILDAKGGAMGGGELKDELRLFHLSFVAPTQKLLEDFLNPLLPPSSPIKFRDFLPDEHGNAQPDPEAPAADNPPDDGEDPEAPADGGDTPPTEEDDAAVLG